MSHHSCCNSNNDDDNEENYGDDNGDVDDNLDKNGDYYGEDYDHDNCAKDVREGCKYPGQRIRSHSWLKKSKHDILLLHNYTLFVLLYGGNISYNIILCYMVERYYIYVIWWTALVER